MYFWSCVSQFWLSQEVEDGSIRITHVIEGSAVADLLQYGTSTWQPTGVLGNFVWPKLRAAELRWRYTAAPQLLKLLTSRNSCRALIHEHARVHPVVTVECADCIYNSTVISFTALTARSDYAIPCAEPGDNFIPCLVNILKTVYIKFVQNPSQCLHYWISP
jgi:hypothetical protein